MSKDSKLKKSQSAPPQWAKDMLDWLINVALTFPWLEIAAEFWKVMRLLSRGMADEGMYEVLAYESTLEIKDAEGKRAQFRKRERVKYLQNNIIAYQDQAWGDGTILLNYRCTPGRVADQYRPGQKTYLLISLREVKSKGDVDEFHIEWGMRNSFTRSVEQWETEVSHRTQYLEIKVLFPEARPPVRLWVIGELQRRTIELDQDALVELPDGRWLAFWETAQPRLHERYILKWEW